MSRKPQTCSDCARRKIKCDKVIPCNNCSKRGSAHLCRRADVSHSIERTTPRPSLPMSPGSPRISSFANSSLTKRPDAEPLMNERILELITTLSDRVRHLEAKLDGVEPRKRPIPVEATNTANGSHSYSPARPLKQARLEGVPAVQNEEAIPEENDYSHNSSDAEAEDAATVLEFLAWGRLKDSNLTNGVRDPAVVHERVTYPDKDIIQVTQAWGQSPTSISGNTLNMENLTISQIQGMLPSQAQVLLLVEYHANWLLFMHCSFHVQTFRRELDQFYSNDNGIIKMTSVGLQWTSLLFAIICGSMTCAKPAQLIKWGFHQDDQSMLAKQWYQASIECLNTARYQQNHSLYSVQTISSSTICAHILGFSNSQSVLLASAVRIAQALGLHRLTRPKRGLNEGEGDNTADTIQKELGRGIWQQLAIQDWFSVPFSETYCVNPLHFTTKQPLHCDENTMEPVPLSKPTITTYGNFLFKIAGLMPLLQDRASQAQTLNGKYDQVIHFDKLMRELVLTQLPSCLNSQTPVDPAWPPWVSVARRCLTITSAHKIIMIHRRFLGFSFHDKRFAFTRRTCLAAAKTIINEAKELEGLPDETPILWTTQAFSVASAIILSLDNFNRHQSAREYAEHRQLVSQTIKALSASASVSSIAARGARLLEELLAEERNVHDQKGKHKSDENRNLSKLNERCLNVAAFVKKFCQSDRLAPGNSPITMSHMPLWLQEDNSSQDHPGQQQIGEDIYPPNRESNNYPNFHSSAAQPPYDILDPGYQVNSAGRRATESFASTFNQNFGEPFDIRTVNWFDDLMGLAPSHSI